MKQGILTTALLVLSVYVMGQFSFSPRVGYAIRDRSILGAFSFDSRVYNISLGTDVMILTNQASPTFVGLRLYYTYNINEEWAIDGGVTEHYSMYGQPTPKDKENHLVTGGMLAVNYKIWFIQTQYVDKQWFISIGVKEILAHFNNE